APDRHERAAEPVPVPPARPGGRPGPGRGRARDGAGGGDLPRDGLRRPRGLTPAPGCAEPANPLVGLGPGRPVPSRPVPPPGPRSGGSMRRRSVRVIVFVLLAALAFWAGTRWEHDNCRVDWPTKLDEGDQSIVCKGVRPAPPAGPHPGV